MGGRDALDLSHPEFEPDPDLTRGEMETLQREVAETAAFADDFGFDADAVGLDSSLPTEAARGGDVVRDAESAGADPEAPLVAGVDQAFLDDRAVSAIVVLQDGQVVERAHAVSPLSIPYIPGLLAFREGGPILDAVATLDHDPDLFVFDGSGRVHFRGAGLATHVGVMLDAPSIGVAKSLLCGEPDADTEGRPAGWRTPIRATDRVDAPDGTVIGHAVQSRQYDGSRSINPLYVSPGHRVSAGTTTDLVLALAGDYKLPEPTRLADKYADDVKTRLG